MRVTTQMLNASAQRAGLPINYTSLLDYMNREEGNSSLVNALSKKKGTSLIDTETRKNNTDLEKAADELTHTASALLDKEENNLFAQTKRSDNRQKLYDHIDRLLDSYNQTMKSLKNASGTMNDFYREMMSEASGEAKEELENIGITFAKDGTAHVDKEKMNQTDLGTLEKLLGSSSQFVNKMNFLSTRISNYAKANADSISNTYASNGNRYTGSNESRYNFLG